MMNHVDHSKDNNLKIMCYADPRFKACRQLSDIFIPMLKVMFIIKTYLYLSIYITPSRLGKEPIEPRQRSQLDQRPELGIHQEQVDQLHFQKMKGQMPIHQLDVHKLEA